MEGMGQAGECPFVALCGPKSFMLSAWIPIFPYDRSWHKAASQIAEIG